MKTSLRLIVLLTVTNCGAGYDDGTSSTTALSIDGGACTDTWSSFGQSFFSSTCAGCHGSYATHSVVQASASQFEQVISSGSMPRNASLTSAQRTQVLAYLACGAP